jgi:hypothetical protein
MTIVATNHQSHQQNMARYNHRSMTATPSNGTSSNCQVDSGQGSDSDDSCTNGRNWKGYALDLETQTHHLLCHTTTG